MHTPAEFELYLKNSGHVLHVDEPCNNDPHNVYTFYVQEDLEGLLVERKFDYDRIVYSRELRWTKSVLCKRCLDSYMGILDCGGHYTNTRLFKQDGSLDDNNDFIQYEPNPDDIVYEPSPQDSDDKIKVPSLSLPSLYFKNSRYSESS